MGVSQSPSRAAALRRPFTSRWSTGHVVMLVAGLLGTLLTLSLLRASDPGARVLVATRDLAPGMIVGASDLAEVELTADEGVQVSLVAADDAGRLDGAVVTASIAAGGVIPRSAIAEARARKAERAMSFALPRARALDGTLAVGDRVDVVAAARDGGRVGYAALDVGVIGVDAGDRGPLGTDDTVSVTLAVDSGEALRIAGALELATVTLVRATGAPPTTGVTLLDLGAGER